MRPLKNICQIAVIGGGLAGLAAARHAARLGRLVTLFEGSGLYGGQVATVGEVWGLPIPGEPSGQDIAIPLLEQARKVGVTVVEARVEMLSLGQRLDLRDGEGREYRPEAVILATGTSPRMLGVPGEEEFYGRGVSRCASCDGGFFRGQHVVVVGGGDAAVHEALILAGLCARVTMVCRGPLRAKREYIDRLAARENVVFAWDSEVVAILGDDGVEGVRLRNVRGGGEDEIACAGVFPFIGGVAARPLLPAAMLDADGLVVTGGDLAVADARIFAAGAARAEYGGNAVQAMSEGVGAAEAAHRMLARAGESAAGE